MKPHKTKQLEDAEGGSVSEVFCERGFITSLWLYIPALTAYSGGLNLR